MLTFQKIILKNYANLPKSGVTSRVKLIAYPALFLEVII